MNTRTILRLALAAAAFGVTGRVSAQNSPAKDSPFMPAGTAEIASDVGETLEFAGVSVIGKKTLVNLYDKQLKKNRWISVGDTVDGLNVLTYDARRDQVVVKVGGEQKLLTLRKSTGVVSAPSFTMVAPNPAMNFNVPTPAAADVIQKIQPPPPASATPATDAPVAAAPVAEPAKPDAPAAPLSIARQEEEARMLVSDLLEIGMAQRKAYEEKQRQTATTEQSGATTPPAPTTPPPANNGG